MGRLAVYCPWGRSDLPSRNGVRSLTGVCGLATVRSDDDILLDIALHFGSAMDLESLLPVVLDRFTTLTAAQRAVFALLDGAGDVQRAVVHNLEWDGDLRKLPLSHWVLEEVYRTGQRVVVSDATHDDTYASRQSVRDLRLRLLVGVPVVTEDRVVGVLYADSQVGGGAGWAPRLDLLEAVTRLVGTAVTNARLFEEQRFGARLLAEMAHDLRSPITVVTSNAKFLRDGQHSAEVVQETAGDIDISAMHMVRIIESSLELSRHDVLVSPACEELLVEPLFDELLRPWRVLAKRLGNRIALTVADDVPPVQTVADTLRVVLENLVSNAVKHAVRGSVVEIYVGAGDGRVPENAWSQPPRSLFGVRRYEPLVAPSDADWVHVSVTNHGERIPEYLRDVLFNAFTGTEESRGALKSSGLGLGIVAVCMAHIGGRVWVARSDDEGTILTVCLPTRLVSVSARVAAEPAKA